MARDWLAVLRRVALALFEARALPGLSERDVKVQREIVAAHRRLGAAFAGYGEGAGVYAALTLPVPVPAKRRKETT